LGTEEKRGTTFRGSTNVAPNYVIFSSFLVGQHVFFSTPSAFPNAVPTMNHIAYPLHFHPSVALLGTKQTTVSLIHQVVPLGKLCCVPNFEEQTTLRYAIRYQTPQHRHNSSKRSVPNYS